MAEGAGQPAGDKLEPRGFIRNPQDFWGGVALVLFAVFALWASSDLPGMRGFAFGPGTAPRLFSWLLVLTGAAVAINGLIVAGPPLEKWGVRAPVLFIASVVFFGATVRPMGLIISGFFTLMIASVARVELFFSASILIPRFSKFAQMAARNSARFSPVPAVNTIASAPFICKK